MTFNKISRLPVIGDLAGVYFVYNTDTPIINGVYVKSTNESAAIKMADVAETLNGSNYVMVYGTGTPTENAAELQAAYDAAKKMPRFIGYLAPPTPTYIYAGQTFGTYIVDSFKYYKVLVDGLYTPYQMPLPEIAESEAIPVRTTVIIAPGEYNFGASAFLVNAPGIDIVSLTGNSDVIISSTEVNSDYNYIYGIKVFAENILIKGINCKTNAFYIESYLDNLICEYCIGGNNSFGSNGTASGTFNYCIAGNKSFGSNGTASGTFNYCIAGDFSFCAFSGDASGIFTNCIGGNHSFGGAGTIASGTFNNCKAGAYSFGTITAIGTFTNCEGGDGSFGDYVASGIFKDCIGGNNSFSRNASGIFTNCKGGDNSFGVGGGDASGTFNNCTGGNKSFGRVSSGTFNNCIGGNYSFGSGYEGTTGIASGTFNDCIGGEVSFGSDGTASGTFTNCKGGAASFGSYGGTISGIFNHCIGGGYSFGFYGGTIGASARLCYTRITSGTFPTPVAGGRLILCIDGGNNIVTI